MKRKTFALVAAAIAAASPPGASVVDPMAY